MRLVAIGMGYCARHFVETRGLAASAFGTTRDRDRMNELIGAGLNVAYCDGADCDPSVREALPAADALLVSAAPNSLGDPVLAAFEAELLGASGLKSVVYLSTIGVYGDHQGAWVDEDSALLASNARSRERLAAEQAWLAFGAQVGARVRILRLAGIYGPGRNALIAVARGQARRIVKPGQAFNRIHVEDVARAVEAAWSAPSGVWNVADDEPGEQGAPIAFAASLLGVPAPPQIAFEDADMTPMARSFWETSKRVSNRRLKQELGVSLAYPTYREGLRALRDDMTGKPRSREPKA